MKKFETPMCTPWVGPAISPSNHRSVPSAICLSTFLILSSLPNASQSLLNPHISLTESILPSFSPNPTFPPSPRFPPLTPSPSPLSPPHPPLAPNSPFLPTPPFPPLSLFLFPSSSSYSAPFPVSMATLFSSFLV